jgi:phosphatidylglycerol:prolipoprotein diacylglycerol transferase
VHPILYQYELFGQERVIAGYGVMVALGMVLGATMAVVISRRQGLDPINVLLVTLIALTAGLIGSYLLFVATMIPEALSDPTILLQGGLVFYGGPLAGIPAAWIACRKLEVNPLKLADVAAPALALGHALGRMGCFLGGCCFGDKWGGPWAVTFTHHIAPASYPPMPRHPVQLYESGFLIVATLAAMLIWPRSKAAGQVGLLYLMSYSLWRLFVETLRADSVRGYVIPGLLTTSQTISVLIVPCCLVGLFWLQRRKANPSRV